MPALVGIMLAPCWHFYYPQYFTLAEYRSANGFLWQAKITGESRIYACLDKPPAGLSESPRIFGLTKMLGSYHYRQSRNDYHSPPRSPSDERKIENVK